MTGKWRDGVETVGWLTSELFSGPKTEETDSDVCGEENVTALGDGEDILEVIDDGTTFPTARVLCGGDMSDSSSSDRTILLSLLFRESGGERTQKEHFQSLGWFLDFRLL